MPDYSILTRSRDKAASSICLDLRITFVAIPLKQRFPNYGSQNKIPGGARSFCGGSMEPCCLLKETYVGAKKNFYNLNSNDFVNV